MHATPIPLEPIAAPGGGAILNDVHSGLNPTPVRALHAPRSEEEVVAIVRCAGRQGVPVSVAGCRHAMGGQQFVTDGAVLDTRRLNRIFAIDLQRGLIEVGAGIQWPELIERCLAAQTGQPPRWGIAQKQTGADDLTLGGCVSANIHGRGLRMAPFVSDLEDFTLVDGRGETLRCSRDENADLFRLAAGGYGLFGVITRVTLRLARRCKLQRVVEVARAGDVVAKLEQARDSGARFGDFQFCIDEKSEAFLDEGVLSCYHTVADSVPLAARRQLDAEHWLRLLHLACTNRAAGYRHYVEHYLASNGQTYWSDLHQLGPYLPDYAAKLRTMSSDRVDRSLMISELFVPRRALATFLQRAGDLLRDAQVPLIYGTVRLIEQDTETFLPWAKGPFACVIFNLLTTHTPEGLARSRERFRSLIDLALELGGSFYLTYHRYARRDQVLRAYPEFPAFLHFKRQFDPELRFQSDWFRHMDALI